MVFTFGVLCAAIRNISEDTITASILADEIKRQGIHVQVFEVWKTSVGIKKPDVYLWNGGQYVIESKFKKRDYLKAVTKLYDSYIKICDELQLSGGFAVLYPEQLTNLVKITPDLDKVRSRAKTLKYTAIAMYSPNDQRNTERFEGTISQLADWIARRINQISKIIEPDIEFIIEVLRVTQHMLQ